MRIEKLVFGGGATETSPPLVLTPTAITVFIGPNNGGKSTALRDIHSQMFGAPKPQGKVVVDTILAPIPYKEQIAKIEALLIGADVNNPGYMLVGRKGSSQHLHSGTFDAIRDRSEGGHWDSISRMVLGHFALNLNGEARLSLANPGGAQRLSDRAASTIATIFKDDPLRTKISNVIHDAFGLHLVVDPTQMGTFSYALATARPAPELERSFTEQAIEFFSRAEPLATASDGTKAFVGVVTEVLAGDSDIVFVDEPEAFLHPGLAYALGREIATNVVAGKQLFAATHSPHFLMGCLSAGAKVNVVRLARRGGTAIANLLDSDTLDTMMSDPLLRSSNVLSGLFYNAAVIVEGDSDRSFYEEINLRLGYVGRGLKHPLFINAHGKQTAPVIASALRNAGVPSAIALDLDWLKEDGVVQKKYFEGIGLPTQAYASAAAARSQTRRDLEATGKNYKREGGIELLTGEAKAAANDFLDGLEKYGLFTVRRGEVEAWLSNLSIPRAKQGWLEQVFSAMGSDRTSATFVHAGDDDVWDFLNRVAQWISEPNRKGMPSS